MAGPGQAPAREPGRETVRLDKWLWFARFFKTRGLAARFVETGKIRVNRQPVAKTAAQVGAGDVLTFPLGGRIRVVQVLGTGLRRGPAPEAQTLYLDLDPLPVGSEIPPPLPSVE